MSEKTKIGASTGDLQRADAAERVAGKAAGELTMIRRRIRTFYNAITYVQFPANSPTWAPDWIEWLETGEVVEKIVEETIEDAAEETVIENGVEIPVDEAG